MDNDKSLGRSGIPGDMGLYYLGESLEFFEDPLDFTFTRFAEHGPIFKTRMCGHDIVFVGGMQGLELFKSGTVKGLGACPTAYVFDLPAFSFNVTNHKRSVLMSENDHQHGFKHLAVLSSITSLCNKKGFFDDCKRVMLKVLTAQASLESPCSGAKICKDIFFHIAVMVLMKDMPEKFRLRELLQSWLNMQISFPGSLLGWNSLWVCGKRSVKELNDLLSAEIKSRLYSNRSFGDDLIGCMLETAMRRSDGYNKTLHDIIEKTVMADCWTLLYSLCVHVASACSWLLVCFERFKNVKEAALTEVRKNEDCLKFDTIRKSGSLPYVEAIIEEALRMYGFLGNPLLRRIALYDINFDEYTIPKGTPVVLALNSYNFCDEFFTDPNVFTPERFLSSGTESRNETNFSFGAGHHYCPGDFLTRMLLKLMTVAMLSQFDTTCDGSQSFKPIYPRGKGYCRKEVTIDRFYFPVPEDLLRYESLTSRQGAYMPGDDSYDS